MSARRLRQAVRADAAMRPELRQLLRLQPRPRLTMVADDEPGRPLAFTGRFVDAVGKPVPDALTLSARDAASDRSPPRR